MLGANLSKSFDLSSKPWGKTKFYGKIENFSSTFGKTKPLFFRAIC